MTDDLSPMLPQPSDDNAPMISGRGTKIYVHMSNAYLVGNLDRLLGGMDDEQRIQYKQALVRLIIWFRGLNIEGIDENTVAHQRFATVIQWLNDPARENEAHVATLYRQIPAFLVPHERLEHDFWCIGRILTTLSIRAASDAARLCIAIDDKSSLNGEIDQWRIDAAWAILQGKEIPPFPELPS